MDLVLSKEEEEEVDLHSFQQYIPSLLGMARCLNMCRILRWPDKFQLRRELVLSKE
jgi:hypothetical protein